MTGIYCRFCGKSPQFNDVLLVRVNPKGEPGIWECSPICGHKWDSFEGRLMAATNEPEAILKEQDND